MIDQRSELIDRRGLYFCCFCNHLLVFEIGLYFEFVEAFINQSKEFVQAFIVVGNKFFGGNQGHVVAALDASICSGIKVFIFCEMSWTIVALFLANGGAGFCYRLNKKFVFD